MPNISIYVPADLKKKLDEAKDINLSLVAQQAYWRALGFKPPPRQQDHRRGRSRYDALKVLTPRQEPR